jgi:anti-sigma regulatory factor (Ser/Thr protein kinase)
MSFASTLYLCPILDILLARIPCVLHDEVRLGLQEALVNAAKHGNGLDPGKTICVQFSVTKNALYWIISDQGCSDSAESRLRQPIRDTLPPQDAEGGRGLCILKRVFDQVFWDSDTSQLVLCKQLKRV